MTIRRLPLFPLLVAANMATSGCVAAAIPVLAGSALIGSRVDGDGEGVNPAQETAAGTVSPAAVSAPAPVPDVTAFPDDSVETAPGRAAQFGFAQFVRYARDIANMDSPLSAMLGDPIALDGVRRRCAAGEKPVALIDLDPAGGVFVPPVTAEKLPGLALGLAVLREAGVVIAWITDLPGAEAGALRTALEQSGLDPRGEDIVSLRSADDERKQLRRDNLAANACIIAIAGDERPDFDERLAYLRNPESGAMLEPVIGNGWFLIEQVFPGSTESKGQQSR